MSAPGEKVSLPDVITAPLIAASAATCSTIADSSSITLRSITFIDRLFVNAYKGLSEAGVYALAVRVSSVIVFLMIAFRLAWPAFAYSIDDESAAKRTYSYVLTYLLFVCCWISIALGTLAPWLV